MKRLCLLILALALLALAQDAKPNYSGAWELDIAKSDFANMPPPRGLTYNIDHQEPKLKLTVVFLNAQGADTSEKNLTTDGQENTNAGEARVEKSRTHWEASDLVTEAQSEAGRSKVERTERWHLSGGGKTLENEMTLHVSDGDHALHLVFHKK
ncbi:MAG TPA: hypothetical protein VEU62_08310 [Bryobacterales bacterium]|nr:hypothetical protein [Bryobacterales bacterium]